MDTRDLRYFIQVAELGSVHSAAERVGRTQPALTKCIKRLEAEVGGRLFFREGRNIALTPLGEDLLRHASAVCRTFDSMVDELQAVALGARGRVRLGISPTSANSILPDVLEALDREAPELRFQVLTGTSNVLRNALRTREIDLVVGPEEDGDSLEFPGVPLHDDDVVVAAAPHHPLAERTASLADLCRYPWLLPTEEIQTRRWLKGRLLQLNIEIDIKIEVSSLISMRHLVARGDFLTFIARADMFFGPVEFLKTVHCRELVFRRKMVMLHLRDRPLTPAAMRFSAVVRAMAAERGATWSTGIPAVARPPSPAGRGRP